MVGNSPDAGRVAREYSTALQEYLSHGGASPLERAHELGRQAVAAGLGVEDVATIHQETLVAFLLGSLTRESNDRIAKKASEFLLETLAPLETMRRSLVETPSAPRPRSRSFDEHPREGTQALSASEARYREFIEQIPAVFYIAAGDEAAAMLFVSPQVERVLGFPVEQWRAEPFLWDRQLHPDDRERVLAERAATLRSGKPLSVEYRMVARDERVVWVRDTAILAPSDEDGGPILRGFLEDITDRKNAELELRDKAQTLRAIFEASPLAIILLDTEGRVRLWNPAAERIFGWKEREVLGTVLQHVPEKELPAAGSWVESGLTGTVFHDVRRRFARKDGTTVEGAVSTATLRDESGRPTGVLAMIADLTQRLALEQQVLQMQKMEGIGSLAGGIAHDFNNTLTGILGYAELALTKVAEDHPAHRHLQEIRKQGERAAALTRQLLAFSRKQVLERKIIDLNRLVTDMETFLRRVITENIELTLDLSPNLRTVQVDPGQVEQVLMNLCINSRDAMPKGGRLTISTENFSIDEEYCRSNPWAKPGDYVRLSVSDTGTGMDEETMRRIFEPFFTTKEQGKGTGLGLSVVYGIVQQHGGLISVHSELGRGTIFRVYFRAVTPQNG